MPGPYVQIPFAGGGAPSRPPVNMGAYVYGGSAAPYTPLSDRSGGGPGSHPETDRLTDLMNEQIGASATQLQAVYQKLYGDLYGQLQTENASEDYQLFQQGQQERQAMQQLMSDFASRGMTRSGAYITEQSRLQEQMMAQRNAVLAQYAAAHAEISARMGMNEDMSNVEFDAEGNPWRVLAEDGSVVAERDPTTGMWTIPQNSQSGLWAEWEAERVRQEQEIRRQYALAGLPNS